MKPAVVLLSGGMDSTTVAAIAKSQGFDVHALSVDYGQRHRVELDSAKRVAAMLGIRDHRIIGLDLRSIGGSALTAEIDVPKDRSDSEMATGVPITYVPARNTILLAVALGFAETLGAFDLFVGVNALDYSGYPDCRPEFIAAFAQLANLATQAGVEGKGRFTIHAPLMQMTKADIVRAGVQLGVDYGQTLTCYDPDSEGRACGHCDACLLRKKGFAEAGVPDPTRYRFTI
ncbi:7-cyano-7-deazaguanine synthase : 7-cyano-7-deazaguanine synthase OS=Myxococcus fulvus (strain ATCC BAA-855 / HW-1) GN=queC PE=3 SV=1: QueC [Tuwongella immobilis]|uniref:7-cyano-7-deazaguanine synthase n=2 Tax=Tuwongella immobilis TaxID=692036 RepID=A0A6C2YHK7_9BACT|nr:7-cyano-7-deazaguanine synthase QueC [Tuwongella immobilis]VIP01010.1 7-cyano-7-deazaguanine synthase : 7-cyano-7-deazaguanine synthase OS=Myxococcus fulvus (strain ATCC BAA-855 / HW-1) GN=queC PE=3 SV=1: QueC [Tuwongella immobilis]VTR97444.1 7-cyano-7-deazaguanine synthase : 7-cyano-7-deazaguanine synthase OS=Myxococcus fulvus (strain ATCC BAA-855 / HW-1) GN=queC PE=3 SV=1: QueC [Tuwongella immobilis]